VGIATLVGRKVKGKLKIREVLDKSFAKALLCCDDATLFFRFPFGIFTIGWYEYSIAARSLAESPVLHAISCANYSISWRRFAMYDSIGDDSTWWGLRNKMYISR